MKKREAWIPAAITLFLVSLVFLYYRIYPYGKLTIAWCDAWQQVVPLLADLKQILLGKGSVMLNLQNAGGMDMWSVVLFFVSGPLNLFVAFVPDDRMIEFFQITLIIRMMLASVTAWLYLRRRFEERLSAWTCGFLGAMYAFSGFTLMFYQNAVWLETAWIFPLLLLGLDRMFEEGKPGLYVAMLVLEMAVNYYLSYMIVIFLVIYSGFYLTFVAGDGMRRRGAALFIGSSLVAALLSAVIWLPSLIAYGESPRGNAGLLQNLRNSPLTPNLYTTVPYLYCTAIFVPALFFLPYGEIGRKPRLRLALVMSLLLIIPIFLEPINRMWHTGSYQCFPVRYGYMTTLFMLIVAGEAIEHIGEPGVYKVRPPKEGETQEDADTRAVRKTFFGAIFACILIILIATFLVTWMIDRKQELKAYPSSLWGDAESLRALSVAFLATAVSYFLMLLLFRFRYLTKSMATVVLCTVFLFEGFFQGSVYMGYAASDQTSYRQVTDLAGRVDPLDTGTALVANGAEKSLFFRVKTRMREIEANWVGAVGMPTLSHYTSLTPENYMYGLKRLGYSSYWLEEGSQGGTAFTDALLSNRYIIAETSKISATDDVAYSNEKYAIVRSPYVFPAAILTAADPEAIDEIPYGNRAEAQNELYKAMFGTDGSDTEDLFVFYEPTTVTGLVERGGRYVFDNAKSGTLKYTLWVTDSETLYFDCNGGRLDTRLNQPENKSCQVKVNGRIVLSEYPVQKANGILELGTFRNQKVTVEITVKKSVQQAVSFGVFGLKDSVMRSLTNRVQGSDLTVSGSSATAILEHVEEGQSLFVSLPFRNGLSVRVNGKETAAKEALGAFLLVPLEAGENVQVEIRYRTPGVTASFVLFGLGVVAAGIWFGILLPRIAKWRGKGGKTVGVFPTVWLILSLIIVYFVPMLLSIM